jgi:hypothetical protein
MADNTLKNTVNGFVDGAIGVVNTASELYSGDSRGIGTNKDLTPEFIVPTPAWFPDSLIRSLDKSLYTKMLNSSAYVSPDKIKTGGLVLDFYNDSGAGFLASMWNSAVNSIVSVAANQIASITSKVDSAINTVGGMIDSVFGEEKKISYSDLIAANNNKLFLTEQPYVVIKGIHVQEYGSQRITLLQKAIPLVKSAFDSIFNDSTPKKSEDFATKVGNVLTSINGVIKKFIGEFYLTDEKDVSTKDWKDIINIMKKPQYRLHGLAETFLSSIAIGHYSMMCKLPYIGSSSAMIQSSGEHGWNSPVTNNASGIIGGILNSIGGLTGMEIGWSEPLSWTSANMSQFTPLRANFAIFNDTFEHFITNYAFIIEFMATTKAVTDTIFIRSPYLYDVEIPGGLRYNLCSCTASISPIGKMRKLSYDESHIKSVMNDVFNININPASVQYIPDAYNVSLEFKSILPDLWNFADGYIRGLTGRYQHHPGTPPGFGFGGYNVGDDIDTKLTKFVDALIDALPAKE